MTASNDYWQQEQQSTPNRQKLANKLNRTRNVLDKDDTITTNLIDHEEAKIEPNIIINDEKQRSPVPLKSTQNV